MVWGGVHAWHGSECSLLLMESCASWCVIFSTACRETSEGAPEDSEEPRYQFWLGSD